MTPLSWNDAIPVSSIIRDTTDDIRRDIRDQYIDYRTSWYAPNILNNRDFSFQLSDQSGFSANHVTIDEDLFRQMLTDADSEVMPPFSQSKPKAYAFEEIDDDIPKILPSELYQILNAGG